MSTTRTTLTLAVIICVTLAVGNEVCRPGFVNLHLGCYFFSHTKAHWHKAWQGCAIRNSHLVTVDTYEENDAIFGYLNATKPSEWQSYWTSGSDLADTDNWTWMVSGLPITYSDWCLGEPSHPEEHCLAMLSRTLSKKNDCWIDAKCNVSLTYICETRC